MQEENRDVRHWKVNIAVATYNGEKYLDEFFQSLLKQTYKNTVVWIRDDGSTDNTLKIILSYCNGSFEGIRFRILTDDLGNLGPGNSFAEIIMRCDPADVYMYADQDDVWNEKKVERAVRAIQKRTQEKTSKIPILYAAGYEFCDEKLNFLHQGRDTVPFEIMDVGKVFYMYGGFLGQGFTLAFNNTCREIGFKERSLEAGHDLWVEAVVRGLDGEYIYDDYASAKYRRHSLSVTKTGMGKVAMWKARWNYFKEVEFFRKTARSIDAYRILFGDRIKKKKDRCFLERFGYYSDFGKKRLIKALYPYRLKITLMEELAIRVAFLCGRG